MARRRGSTRSTRPRRQGPRDRNPENYFADVEQAAFNPANVVPGIGFSPDKMLQGRLFSYGGAQRHRLGVNHHLIPVNQARCPVHSFHRDGAMRVDGNHGSTLGYEPNSYGEWGEQPEFAEPPLPLEGAAAHWNHREDSDDYSQPRASGRAPAGPVAWRHAGGARAAPPQGSARAVAMGATAPGGARARSPRRMAFLSGGQLHDVVSSYGYWVVAGTIAGESMGIPLPGETALITAAAIAGTTHDASIWLVIAAAAGGAIVGDNVGFWIGRRFGTWLLLRYGRYVRLTPRRIKLGQYLFLRFGGSVVFFGRFVAILRALAALLAGANCMPWPRFLLFNAAGGVVWALSYGLAAYYVGNEISHVAEQAAVAIGLAAAAFVVAALALLRRHESELEDRADAALPGPLRPGRSRTRG